MQGPKGTDSLPGSKMNVASHHVFDVAGSGFHVSFGPVGLRWSRLKGQCPEFTLGGPWSREDGHWEPGGGEEGGERRVWAAPAPCSSLLPR